MTMTMQILAREQFNKAFTIVNNHLGHTVMWKTNNMNIGRSIIELLFNSRMRLHNERVIAVRKNIGRYFM